MIWRLIALAACIAVPLSSQAAAPKQASPCARCEPSSKLRGAIDVRLPTNAIVYDFGNGPFWKNSYLLIIDLDAGEALTYRFPPDKPKPTTLQLAGKEKLAPHDLSVLREMAKTAWNPPRDKLPNSFPTDTFQTIYILRGANMVEAMSLGNGPSWFSLLLNKIDAVARPSEHLLGTPGD